MSRQLRGAAGLALCAALALTACGPREQEDVLPERFVDPPEISVEAEEVYGEGADDAYEQVSEFLLDHSTPEELLDPDNGTPSEAELIEPVVPMMTAEAAQAWRASVSADVGGDTEARDVVRLLRFHTWDGEIQAPRLGDALQSQLVSDGTVDLSASTVSEAADEVAATAAPDAATSTAGTSTADGPGDAAATSEPVDSRPALEVSLTHHAWIRVVDSGVPTDVELRRPLTFTLVPDGDDWLIAAFEGVLQEPDDASTEDPAVTTGDTPDDAVSTTSPGR